MTSPHVLYRMFDAEGALLYIGITSSFHGRLAHHASRKDWFGDVASMTLEHFPDRGSVLAAEASAIAAENPLHNIVRYTGDLSLHSFRCPDEAWRSALMAAAERGENFSEELRRMVNEYAEA